MTQNLENYRKILQKYHRQVSDRELFEIVQNIRLLAQIFDNFGKRVGRKQFNKQQSYDQVFNQAKSLRTEVKI